MKAEELHKAINIMNARINDIIGKETRGVHFGGKIELLAAIASIEELYDLNYAPEAEAKRSEIMNIMINAMLEEQKTSQIIQLLKDKCLNDEDSQNVAYTEVQRIKNLAKWHQYYGAGYKFFSAKCADDSCKKCKEAYDGEKYSLEQLDMLPPLHGECRCDLIFHRK
ncbi:hypothetical protein [Methanobacterium oryzae]|uniref:hypothetical protein n=1 Tax=Methanobacterium oryzae TaxID=69540 RepID=UPI003D1AFC38